MCLVKSPVLDLRYLRNAQTRGLSHPLPVLRAKEIDAWSRSDMYRALIGRGQGAAALAVSQQQSAAA